MKKKVQVKHRAKFIATMDIKQDLRKQGKCFIAFRVELNPVMRELTKEYLKAQKGGCHGKS